MNYEVSRFLVTKCLEKILGTWMTVFATPSSFRCFFCESPEVGLQAYPAAHLCPWQDQGRLRGEWKVSVFFFLLVEDGGSMARLFQQR